MKKEGKKKQREKGRINKEKRDGKGYGNMNIVYTSNKTHFFCNFDSQSALIRAHNAMKFSDFLGYLIEIFGT